uniref:Uncharacterized protein n=1 Tax=Rhodosorus marinus TaxID=101924 RepID=A0A7S3EMJ7_9RHOD
MNISSRRSLFRYGVVTSASSISRVSVAPMVSSMRMLEKSTVGSKTSSPGLCANSPHCRRGVQINGCEIPPTTPLPLVPLGKVDPQAQSRPYPTCPVLGDSLVSASAAKLSITRSFSCTLFG